jgi:hypothetical protein
VESRDLIVLCIRNLPLGNTEKNENSHDSRCSYWCSNRISPEHNSEALPPTCSISVNYISSEDNKGYLCSFPYECVRKDEKIKKY